MNCDICDKVVSNSIKLWKHKVFHHNETQDAWICEKCPRKNYSAFLSEAAYDKHKAVFHSGIKPHKCNICNKAFVTIRILNLHISRVHEGTNQHRKEEKKFID